MMLVILFSVPRPWPQGRRAGAHWRGNAARRYFFPPFFAPYNFKAAGRFRMRPFPPGAVFASFLISFIWRALSSASSRFGVSSYFALRRMPKTHRKKFPSQEKKPVRLAPYFFFEDAAFAAGFFAADPAAAGAGLAAGAGAAGLEGAAAGASVVFFLRFIQEKRPMGWNPSAAAKPAPLFMELVYLARPNDARPWETRLCPCCSKAPLTTPPSL